MAEPKFTEEECGRCCGAGKIKRVRPAWLRHQREGAELSLRDFADLVGFSPAYISDIELGRRSCTPKILGRYEGLRLKQAGRA